jgi:hypothetical protein
MGYSLELRRVPKEKKSVQVTVKLSPEDHSRMLKAADRLWPGADLSKAQILRNLARIATDHILKK